MVTPEMLDKKANILKTRKSPRGSPKPMFHHDESPRCSPKLNDEYRMSTPDPDSEDDTMFTTSVDCPQQQQQQQQQHKQLEEEDEQQQQQQPEQTDQWPRLPPVPNSSLVPNSPKLASNSPKLASNPPKLASNSPKLAPNSHNLASNPPKLVPNSPGVSGSPKAACGRGQTLRALAEQCSAKVGGVGTSLHLQSEGRLGTSLLGEGRVRTNFLGEGSRRTYEFPDDEQLLDAPAVAPMVGNVPPLGTSVNITKIVRPSSP